jgi:hypothetical protein
MANGAAGCGYEFSNSSTNSLGISMCGHLSRSTQDGVHTFSCLKFRQSLETQRITGHPFRCDECTGKKVNLAVRN